MCHYVHTHTVAWLFSPGVEDDMALALELSRREEQPNQSPQKPHIHSRSSDTHRPEQRRSFSSAPSFNYRVETSSEDDEDEALQMALACSLSEMEAKEREALIDTISGAVKRAKAGKHQDDVHTESHVLKTKNTTVVVNGKVVSEETEKTEEKRHGRISPEPEIRRPREEKGFSPDSPSTSSSSTPNSEQEPEPKTNNGVTKKKKKCTCVVC